MKAILEFQLPEESEEYQLAVQGAAAAAALDAIRAQIFRPIRKHGYSSDSPIGELLEKGVHPDPEELIGHLEDLFNDILRDYEIKG